MLERSDYPPVGPFLSMHTNKARTENQYRADLSTHNFRVGRAENGLRETDRVNE